MFQLIVLVVTIGLIAAVTATTLNYLPLDALLRQQMHKDADRGMKALECAVTHYLDAHRDSTGNIVYPGDGVDLVSAVTPAYGFVPADVRKEMSWDIVTGQVSGMQAVGICLRPITTTNAVEQDVLKSLQQQLPVGSTYIGTGCNATANVAGGGYLTYWVPLAHVN